MKNIKLEIGIGYSDEDESYIASLDGSELTHGDTPADALQRLLEYILACDLDEILEANIG